MSTKKKPHAETSVNHSENSDVLERRLRPIYDRLDFGNYKKALQECEKVLKKHGDMPCVQALKALTLIRLGRTDEGSKLVREVHLKKPCDKDTLPVLSACYKELHKNGPVVELYENAVEKNPANEDYLSHLFMAYVRIGCYKKQHQVAVKLHKLKPNNHPYHYWRVMSLILQAGTEEPELGKTLYTLAEKLLNTERKLERKEDMSAEMTLLTIVLEKQNKLKESVNVRRSDLEKRTMLCDEMQKRIKIAELLSSLGEMEECIAIYKELLSESPDNWSLNLKLLDASFTAVNQSSSDSADLLKSLVDDMELRKSQNLLLTKPLRGPQLAVLELYSRLCDRNNSHSDSVTKLECNVLRYLELFGAYPCCIFDVRPYVIKLISASPTSSGDLLQLFWSSLALGDQAVSKEFYSERDALQKHVLYSQLELLSGRLSTLTAEDKVSHAQLLRKRFLEAATNVEKDTLPTDVKCCDAYLLLSAHIMADLYHSTQDSVYCIQAIGWLEEGLKISPSTHQFSILLVYLYTHMGAYSSVQLRAEKMDIKQILYDSLGYLVSLQASSCGQYNTALKLYSHILKYFSAADREIAEGLVQCYTYGNFSKVEEFGNYQFRTAHSVQYAYVLVEKVILDLLLNSKSHSAVVSTVNALDSPPENDLLVPDLCDNRDIPVATCWDSQVFTNDMKDATFKELKTFIKLRSLMVRLTVAANSLAEGSGNGTSSLTQLISSLVSEFKQLSTSVKGFQSVHVPKFTVIHTRLASLCSTVYLDIFLSLCQLVSKLVMLNQSDENSPNDLSDDFRTLSDLLSGICQAAKPPDVTVSNVQDFTKYIDQLSNITEMLSFAVIFAGIYWKFFEPVRVHQKKTKKAAMTDSRILKCLQTSHSSLKNYLHHLEALINTAVQKASVLSDSSQTMLNFKCNQPDDVISTVLDTIKKSYHVTHQEIMEVLSSKKNYLDSLTTV